MGMTIDEAIKHAEEVGNGCSECAAEHRQLAEWLHKYQKIEEILDDCELEAWEVLEMIKKVVEDGKTD